MADGFHMVKRARSRKAMWSGLATLRCAFARVNEVRFEISNFRFQIPDYLRSQISDLRFQQQNMSLLLFLQSPTPGPTVVNVPERMPALLTIIYLAGLLLIV